MCQIGPCPILWVEFDYQALTDEAALSVFSSLLHPYWRESEVQLTEKQAVLLMHDICLKTKPKYKKNSPVYGRIAVDYAPLQDLSIDIKMMPQAFGGYHLLLVITCYQTNFTIAVPLRDRQTQTVAESLIY